MKYHLGLCPLELCLEFRQVTNIALAAVDFVGEVEQAEVGRVRLGG